MDEKHLPAASSRFFKLAQQFHDKEFRDTYVAAHTRRFLARQMRKFRGHLSQAEFADRLDKQQTIVSRLENPNYSGWTLGTLLEIASKLNVGLVVRFVDFPMFLKFTGDLSEEAMCPSPYNEQEVDDSACAETNIELDKIKETFRPRPIEPERSRKKASRLAIIRSDENDTHAASYQSAISGMIPKVSHPENSAAFQSPRVERAIIGH